MFFTKGRVCRMATTNNFNVRPLHDFSRARFDKSHLADLLEIDHVSSQKLIVPKFQLELKSGENIVDALNKIFEQHKMSPNITSPATLTANIRNIIRSDQPHLNYSAQYLFEKPGKNLRPLITLAMSVALNAGKIRYNNSDNSMIVSSSPPFVCGNIYERDDILTEQYRLAEISETIHEASLLHDDILDNSEIRRNRPSLNKMYNNIMSVSAGNFYMSRVSQTLTHLDPAVNYLLSNVLVDLMKGELIQAKQISDSKYYFQWNEAMIGTNWLDLYLLKCYYKSASLIANVCKATAILAGFGEDIQDIAYEFGKCYGIAFQLRDDYLDLFSNHDLGKPFVQDLKQNIVTAPLLFEAENNEKLKHMIMRRFQEPKDIDEALKYLYQHENDAQGGKQRTLALSYSVASGAIAAILRLQPSHARSILISLVHHGLNRNK